MKRILTMHNKGWFSVVLLLVATVFASSCKKDIYEEFDQSVNKPLELTASKQSVLLNESEYAKEIFQLSWTTGSNYGTNSSMSYKLYIDREGNNFQNAVVEDLGKTTFQKKYTVQDFNSLLSQLNLTPGVEGTIEAKIVSKVSGTNLGDSTTTTFKVTTYQPVTTTLFIIGDAAPNGWSADNATALSLNNSIPGRFTFEGKLNAGEFKFITTKGSFSPSYNKGATANQLVLRTSDSQPDDKFAIATAGRYVISVNLLDLSISIAEGNAPPYSQLWVVGDATPNGWNIDNPNPMRVDRSNPFVFTFNGVLNAGEFKIPTAKGNWGTDYYMPLVNAQDLNLTGVQLTAGGSPDNKWKITTPGAYKIKLDLENMKIHIKPFTAPAELYLVGDATPAGWNIDNPTPLVKSSINPNIFTFTGPLTSGEFKMPIAKGNWGGDFYMPVIANEGAESTEMKFVPGGSPDNKWKITAAQAGNYKITVDVLYETIKFERQ